MRFIRHPIVRLILIIVSAFICIGLIRSIIGTIRQNDILSERRAVLEKEEKRSAILQEKLRESTSASFLEKQAREKLGLVKEGETVVLLGQPQTQEDENVNSSVVSESLWKRWWKLFF